MIGDDREHSITASSANSYDFQSLSQLVVILRKRQTSPLLVQDQNLDNRSLRYKVVYFLARPLGLINHPTASHYYHIVIVFSYSDSSVLNLIHIFTRYASS
jgi:hypothetical protein